MRHLDGDKLNFSPENLQWAMRYEDMDNTCAENRILDTLKDLEKFCGPVTASFLSDHLGWPRRTVNSYLARLEVQRRVMRPGGPRSGWLVCSEAINRPIIARLEVVLTYRRQRARWAG